MSETKRKAELLVCQHIMTRFWVISGTSKFSVKHMEYLGM